jgi:RNA polymerase sigma factor (sigma-70 family)
MESVEMLKAVGSQDVRSASARREVVVAGLEEAYRVRLEVFVRVAAAIVGDRDWAVDVVHEAFVRALARAGDYRGEGSVEAWVWSVVVNEARRAASAQPAPLAPIEPKASVSRLDQVDGLRRLVAALPERQRLVLFLRYYADLDYRSIAVATGVEPGTVAATLSHAHASLRRALGEVSDGV